MRAAIYAFAVRCCMNAWIGPEDKMKAVSIFLWVVGVLAFVLGLLWVGQGLGVVRWPAESFMIDMRPWAWRGAALTLFGLLLIWLGGRLK